MFGSHKRISIFDSMVLMTPRACGRVFGARSGTRWAVPQCRRARSASALVSRHPRRAGWALRSSPAASSSLRADAVAPELAPLTPGGACSTLYAVLLQCWSARRTGMALSQVSRCATAAYRRRKFFSVIGIRTAPPSGGTQTPRAATPSPMRPHPVAIEAAPPTSGSSTH